MSRIYDIYRWDIVKDGEAPNDTRVIKYQGGEAISDFMPSDAAGRIVGLHNDAIGDLTYEAGPNTNPVE